MCTIVLCTIKCKALRVKCITPVQISLCHDSSKTPLVTHVDHYNLINPSILATLGTEIIGLIIEVATIYHVAVKRGGCYREVTTME